MSVAAQLPRPGVEVIQEFRSVSPTIVTPTLVPCVVGVAKQLVEVTETDSSGNTVLNSEALITLPAFFISEDAVGSPAVYGSLDGDQLILSINNGADVTVTFADPTSAGLTPATVVSQINTAFRAAGVSSAIAELIEDSDTWQLRTVGVGEFQTIYVSPSTDEDVLAAFGIGAGKTYTGLTQYNQYQVDIPQAAFPDPNDNLSELAIEFDSIRVFVATEGGGAGLTEFLQDEAFLRNGVVDTEAAVSGDVDTATLEAGMPANIAGDTLVMSIDGAADITVDLTGYAGATKENLRDAIQAAIDALGGGATISLAATTNYMVFTTDNPGADGSISLKSGALLDDLFTGGQAGGPYTDTGVSIAAVDDGNGDVVTPILEFAGYDFDDAPTAGALVGSAAVSLPLTAGDTLIISDGQQAQTIVFTAAATITDVVNEINAVVGTAAGGKLTASDFGGGELQLVTSDIGSDAFIKILGGTALADLDPGGTPEIFAGAELSITSTDPVTVPWTNSTAPKAHVPQPGDELYIDGVFYANITETAPGGTAAWLKIDRQVTISTQVGRDFYIIAKDLPDGGSATRPYPDLDVDLNGDVHLKHSFIRDREGNPTDVTAPIYLAYTAVRQDVTALADQPGLLRFDDTATLDTSLGPLTTDNPLGLGLYFALLNAPGAQVTGLGVDAISADSPFGTVEAFTRAAEYLEGFEVYAIAILTHDETVAQVYNTHVNFKSEPEEKGERIVLWNPAVPTRARDTLVGSGTDGDGLTTLTFDTKIASLSTLLNNAGVNPVGTIPASEGVYLDLASDDYNYSIESVSGSVVTIRTTFAAGENDDSFYSTSALTLPVISAIFSVKVRGSELLTPTGQQDRQSVAENMAVLGQSFLNRRFWMTFPDTCAALLSGLEQSIDGFYMNAAIVGMIGQQPPQQSFTNFPMAGFTRVIGSNDTFSETQLNIMAGGGTYIIVQDGAGAPLTARMALTTDLTSIETRTDSITKVVDFTAKFLRRSLQSFIGRFNITQGFLDSLGSVIQGVLGFLVESGVLIGGTLNNIIQDEDAPDTVLVDVSLDVPYPCNYIRLTLVV